MSERREVVAVGDIESRIYTVRGLKVMLDSDLAGIYGVTTKRLNEAVKRNSERFPENFMFQLTAQEHENLRSQIATSSFQWGGRRFLPHVFTEHGAVMLACVLNSPIATAASIPVVETFIRLRQMAGTVKELAGKLAELERKYDKQFPVVFEAIRRLMGPPEQARYKKGEIGVQPKPKP